jgi:Ca2+-binding RTX toxin-like protein
MAKISVNGWELINPQNFLDLGFTPALNETQSQLASLDTAEVKSWALQSSTKYIAILTNGGTVTATGSAFGTAAATITSISYKDPSGIKFGLAGAITANGVTLNSFNFHSSSFDFSFGCTLKFDAFGDFLDGSAVRSFSMASSSGYSISVKGTFLINNVDETVSGTVSGFSMKDPDGHFMTVSGMSLPYSTFDSNNSLDDLLTTFNAINGGNDSIVSGTANDSFFGGAGNDTLVGGEGNDTIDGGAGNDNVNAGTGDDNIFGGDGTNKITAGAGADSIVSGDDKDTIDGGSGNDTINAGGGNDSVLGGADADLISGGAGRDTIDGGLGNDLINGDAGNDTIKGGDGADTIAGGRGNDLLTGGKGDDIFIIGSDGAGADIITDFSMITSGKGAALITTQTDTLKITGHDMGDGIAGFTMDDFEIGSPADGTKGVMINFSDGGGSVLLKNVSLADLTFVTDVHGQGVFELHKGSNSLTSEN